MAILISSPNNGDTFLTNQTIPVAFSGGPLVSYTITPPGTVVPVGAGTTSPLNIGPIGSPGTYSITLNDASGGSASVSIKVEQGPGDPEPGGDPDGLP